MKYVLIAVLAVLAPKSFAAADLTKCEGHYLVASDANTLEPVTQVLNQMQSAGMISFHLIIQGKPSNGFSADVKSGAEQAVLAQMTAIDQIPGVIVECNSPLKF